MTAVQPNSESVRRRLKVTGLNAYVKRISSGPSSTTVVTMEGAAEEVAAALRPLWNDGSTRVKIVDPDTISIHRSGWESTTPATPKTPKIAPPRKCYTVMEEHRNGDGWYIVCLLVEHDPVIGVMRGNGENARPWLAGKTRQDALATCDSMNAEQFGLTPGQRADIVAGWMREFLK